MEQRSQARWMGLSCLELELQMDLSSRLFASLSAAAEEAGRLGLAVAAVASYRSIAFYWEEAVLEREEREEGCQKFLFDFMEGADFEEGADCIRVPVRYGGEDLARVAEYHGMEEEAVIRTHSDALYCVASVGFVPGFAYLYGLPAALETPRLGAPKVSVPAGALGIGGAQTGIYPGGSPGGWNLIGQVEEAICRDLCPRLRVGDQLQFEVQS